MALEASIIMNTLPMKTAEVQGGKCFMSVPQTVSGGTCVSLRTSSQANGHVHGALVLGGMGEPSQLELGRT